MYSLYMCVLKRKSCRFIYCNCACLHTRNITTNITIVGENLLFILIVLNYSKLRLSTATFNSHPLWLNSDWS